MKTEMIISIADKIAKYMDLKKLDNRYKIINMMKKVNKDYETEVFTEEEFRYIERSPKYIIWTIIELAKKRQNK